MVGHTGGMPSEAADALKSVALATAPTLASAGFKKRRNAFNRTTEAGVVQVLSFQMDKPARGAASAGPARRFNVNLGVYIHDDGDGATPPSWVNDGDCQLRQSVAELVPDGPDAHLALDDVDLASWATFHVLSMYALPWLDERRTRAQVLAARD